MQACGTRASSSRSKKSSGAWQTCAETGACEDRESGWSRVFRRLSALRRDCASLPRGRSSSVWRFAGNSGRAFSMPVEEARHVRGREKSYGLPMPRQGNPAGWAPRRNAKDIVLSTRKPRCFQEPFCLLAEGVGGLQERHENAVLQGGRRSGGIWTASSCPHDSCL